MKKSLSYRKTKIVATLGPASNDEKTLGELINAGLNVARLNFSHGTLEQHAKTVESIRKVAAELEAPVGILQDLQGPKIRLLNVEGEQAVKPGDALILSDPEGTNSDAIQVDLKDMHKLVSPGQSLFIDDGIIELSVEKVDGHDIHCQVIHGGFLRPRKGVNLPDTPLPIASMTEKDERDLENGIALGFDYVALSFVRHADDIIKLKKRLADLGSSARVVAKIEKKEAIENIEAIIDASDAIMVARGDLSVEIGQVHLPVVQKRIIRLCNHKGKPVITATQMLDSMQVNSRPTRAEITDVANAVLDGSDALMLSGETAHGAHPVLSVKTMHDIIMEAEKQPHLYYRFKNRKTKEVTVPESIAISAVLCSKQLHAKTIVCLSTTGRTAQNISKFRPKAKLVAVTAKTDALGKLELCWGVQTLTMDTYSTTEEAIDKIEALLFDNGIIKEGDDVVLTMGVPVAQGQKTNAVRVFTFGNRKKVESNRTRPARFR